MKPLDEIVLVSEEDFTNTYGSRYHLEAAVRELAACGITFPIKYTSPFFRQLSALAVMVYFKGTLSVVGRDSGFVEYSPTYAVQLFVTNKFGREWVNSKLSPFFSVSEGSNSVSVGNASVSNLNRPLARILYCLEIPTDGEHFTASRLPSFVAGFASMLPHLGENNKAVARALLLDFYEVFLRIKTTMANDFYWEFFLPIKKDIATATLFRNNLARVLTAAIPEVQLHKLGVPRPRTRNPALSPIDYYDSMLCIKRDGVEALIANYADAMRLAPLLASKPRLREFYLQSRNGSAPA
ncbi:hypothetical protein HYY73_01210 [Candidatus Woesearchaeota archaeon]|nr:hypothetical protein [Candidatus Woesearchaeota archaeon]